MDRSGLSFRTQFAMVVGLCLGLLGCGTLLVNAYLIRGLKDEMRTKAIRLAEDQVRGATERIVALMAQRGGRLPGQAPDMPALAHQVEIVLKGNRNVMAMCLIDAEGEVILADMGQNAQMVDVKQSDQGVELELDPSDFQSIKMRLRRSHPDVRAEEREIDIVHDDQVLGQLHYLITDSEIYDGIESASLEITRRLWSVVLAFVGVLALGLYLLARLFQRQLGLLARNAQLDRMAYVGTLASGLAHEIRNPLNAVSVHLGVAQEEIHAGEKGSSEVASEALEFINGQVARLNHSVTNFMEFAHPRAERTGVTDLCQVVQDVLEMLKPQLKAAQVAVEMDIPGEAPLQADASGLRQVIYNAVLNAIQAMESGGAGLARKIRIGGRRESAQWRLWIEDTGPGIDPGQEEQVFEVFHTSKAAGSGFGLSIARAIVQAHQGEIIARRAEGGGTRIEIVLPETASETRPWGPQV